MKNAIINSGKQLPFSRKILFALICLTITIFIIYSNTFDASWHFDDINNIIENPSVHLSHISWPEIKKTFSTIKGKVFRPVAFLSFAFNYYFGGNEVFGYHLVNTLIHCISAVFLFLLINLTLNLPSLRERYESQSYNIALLAALLWAINPIQTQAVTYIVQRMANMAAMLFVMSMVFYLKARTSDEIRKKTAFWFACILSALLSFGTKENAVMLPACLFLFEVLLIQGRSLGEWFRRRLGLSIFIIILLLLIVFAYLLITEGGKPLGFMSGYEKRTYGPLERMLTQPRVIIFYISLLLYPVSTRLCVNHDMAVSRSLFNPPETIIAILVIAAIVVSAVLISKKRPLISFSIFFFFLNHLIEGTFLPIELVFEHRNYLPSMFFFVPVSIFLIGALTLDSLARTIRVFIAAFMVLIMVGHGHAAFIRNFSWKTEESLWIDAVEKYPDVWRPYVILGKYYSDKNQSRRALHQYKLALQRKTSNDKKIYFYYKTFFNIGGEYFKLGKHEIAMDYYKKALEISDKDAQLLNNIGALLMLKKEFKEAETWLRKAISLKSKFQPALTNLGALLIEQNRRKEAIKTLKKALHIRPRNYATLMRLSRAYRETGKYGKAFVYAKRGLSANRINFTGLLFLVELYDLAGCEDKASKILSKLVAQTGEKNLEMLINRFKNKERYEVLFPNKDVTLSNLRKACRMKSSIYRKLTEL